MSEEIDKLKDEEQEKLNEELMVDEEERRPSGARAHAGSRAKSGWIGGVVLILIGGYFLFGNLFGFALVGNWWAAFILIPAVYSLARAYEDYRKNGRLTERGRSNLIGGLMIGTVAFIFLFGLNFGNLWPLFLIIIGVGILLRGAVK
jgi:hypothetical protein